MTHTLPAPDFKNLQDAYRAETAVMLDFVGGLTDVQWNAPSKAAGWSIADMVAHIGSTANNMYIFASRFNDLHDAVARRHVPWVDARSIGGVRTPNPVG